MSYVLGDLEFSFSKGKVIGALDKLEVKKGNRPNKAEEFGSDPKILETLNTRLSKMKTVVRLGAGGALVVNNVDALQLLPPESSGFGKRLRNQFSIKHGDMPSGKALIGVIRDLGAGGTWTCADVCAGIVEIENYVIAAMRELIELGFHKPGEGYLRFILPDEFEEFQAYVDKAQNEEWAKPDLAALELGPSFKAKLSFTAIDADSLNGRDVVLAGEPLAGSVEIIFVFSLTLPGEGWRVRDTEHLPDGKGLNRRPYLILPQKDGVPILHLLAEDGNGLDIKLPPIYLDGKGIEGFNSINQKTRAVLQALGWFEAKK